MLPTPMPAEYADGRQCSDPEKAETDLQVAPDGNPVLPG